MTWRWRRWDNLVRNVALPGSYEATSTSCSGAREFADLLDALNLRENLSLRVRRRHSSKHLFKQDRISPVLHEICGE